MKPDYYDILGVHKSATTEEIRKAFKKKAMRLHPDRDPSPDALERFELVREAYVVLSDPHRRNAYDGNEDDEPDIDNRARNTLMEMFDKIISDDSFDTTKDPIHIIKMSAKQFINNNNKAINANQLQLRRLENIEKRIHRKHPDDTNYLAFVVRQKRDSIEKDNLKLEEEIEISERVLTLLEEFDFEVEVREDEAYSNSPIINPYVRSSDPLSGLL